MYFPNRRCVCPLRHLYGYATALYHVKQTKWESYHDHRFCDVTGATVWCGDCFYVAIY